MCKFMLTSLTELITHSCTCCSSSSYMIMQLCMCALSTLYCCALGALHCCVCVHNAYCNVEYVPTRRNENLMGTRASIGKQPGAFTIIGDDPKKYAAAMVEYTKEKVR